MKIAGLILIGISVLCFISIYVILEALANKDEGRAIAISLILVVAVTGIVGVTLFIIGLF